MVLAGRKCGLAPHNINVPVACLLFAVLVSLDPRNAWAQSCSNSSNICPTTPLAPNRFYIHDLGGNFQNLGGGRCIDAGPPQSWAQGSPVFINTCNHTGGQEIYVAEIASTDNDHDVGLAVYPAVTTLTAPGTTTTGATNAGFCIGVHGGTVAANAALELQTCNPLSPAQRFAVDGDAILMGLQKSGKVTRDFVIERQNGSTVPQTPLVVATRVVSEEQPLRIDARYFRFDAVDGSGAAPTSGFLRVACENDLVSAAQCGWGTVVQIDESQPLVLTSLLDRCPRSANCPFPLGNIEVADGTTIRGYRSQTDNGPQIQTCIADGWPVFQVAHDANPQSAATGRAVRFTGFRLHGPNSGCNPVIGTPSDGEVAIEVDQSRDGSLPLPSVWIDHMDSYWPGAASGAALPNFTESQTLYQVPAPEVGYPDTPIALMVGNFMHDDSGP
jgi:hypothetical protein